MDALPQRPLLFYYAPFALIAFGVGCVWDFFANGGWFSVMVVSERLGMGFIVLLAALPFILAIVVAHLQSRRRAVTQVSYLQTGLLSWIGIPFNLLFWPVIASMPSGGDGGWGILAAYIMLGAWAVIEIVALPIVAMIALALFHASAKRRAARIERP